MPRAGLLSFESILTAISHLAPRFELIRRLFCQSEINDLGIYCIALCVNGLWIEITVDDLFPVTPFSNELAFTSSFNNSLWPSLLEKALAKVYGGYMNLGNLTVSEVL